MDEANGERGKGRGQNFGRQGLGPPSRCMCPSCGHSEPHEVNVPCAQKTCPECGVAMQGQD